MSHLYKNAAYRINSVEELTNILSKEKGVPLTAAQDKVKDIYTRGGSGSAFLDFGIKPIVGLVNKNVKKRINQLEDNIHNKVFNWDIKTAKKIDDKLQNKHPYIRDLFNKDEIINVSELKKKHLEDTFKKDLAETKNLPDEISRQNMINKISVINEDGNKIKEILDKVDLD